MVEPAVKWNARRNLAVLNQLYAERMKCVNIMKKAMMRIVRLSTPIWAEKS